MEVGRAIVREEREGKGSFMSFQVLSRKYRPQLFREIIGQDHIARVLQNAIKTKSVGHAYLFTGTRGIGKTSAARIFAKALTCQDLQADGNPCLKCVSCLSVDRGTSIDVQEMDGASHNGVEHVRSLAENVHYLPSLGHYKVYIIDEVHMLSSQAFNALLKTLEEPPAHVVFILATTEPEKLLETVLSRCQRLDFRNAGTQTLMAHLSQLLKAEKVDMDTAALRQVCQQGKGSFRDTLSLLEQILSYSADGNITEEIVAHSLGLVKGNSLRLLTNAILKGDIKTLEVTYHQCLRENVDLKHLTQGILDSFYFIIQHREDSEKLYQLKALENGLLEDISLSELFWIFETFAKDFDWAVKSMGPEKVIEVILKKVSLRREFFQGLGPIKLNHKKEQKKEASSKKITEEEVKVTTRPPGPVEDKQTVIMSWDQFLKDMFKRYPALGANLEQGNILEGPSVQDGSLYVNVGFDSSAEIFLDSLKDPQTFDRLKKIAQEYFGVSRSHIKLSYVSSEKRKQTNFRSKHEILEKKRVFQKEKSREKLLNNKYIREAQELFNSEVSQVILR